MTQHDIMGIPELPLEPPDFPEPEPPHCPVCMCECDTVYIMTRTGETIGCENCIRTLDAWDVKS